MNIREKVPERATVLFAVVPAAAYVFLLRVSWRRTAHPLVDFGREVYTAWRLSEGEMLYRDVDSLFGPLAAYVDAGVFALVGPSLVALFAVNACLVAAATVLVYSFVFRVAHRLTACLASLTFLVVFAFGHSAGPNYNFLSPYSQAAVWGIVLGMAAVTSLERWLSEPTDGSGSGLWPFAAGFAAGLTVLTKPEIALATLGASSLAVALATHSRIDRGGSPLEGDRRSSAGAVLRFALGASLPLAVTAAAFWTAGSAPLAVEALAAGFEPLLSENPLTMEFYRHWAGLHQPGVRGVEIVAAAVAVVGTLLALARLDRLLLSLPAAWLRRVARIVVVGAVISSVVVWAGARTVIFDIAPRATPLLLLAGLFWCGKVFRRRRAEKMYGPSDAPAGPRQGRRTDAWRRARALGVWLTFSLLLLAKLGLSPRFSHYGFYLAAPAGVAVVFVLVELLPRWTGSRMGGEVLPRLAGVGFVLVVILGHGVVSSRQLRAKDVRIGHGLDAMWVAGPLGEAARTTLDRIEEFVPSDASLTVIPEGASLNYWSRRVTPTPHLSFMPPEMDFYGAERMRRSLGEARPDYVVVWDRPLPDYGGGRYGQDTGRGAAIVGFVHDRYRCVDRIAVRDADLALEIRERRDRSGTDIPSSGC